MTSVSNIQKLWVVSKGCGALLRRTDEASVPTWVVVTSSGGVIYENELIDAEKRARKVEHRGPNTGARTLKAQSARPKTQDLLFYEPLFSSRVRSQSMNICSIGLS
jgi:hypothetical protein